jgi:hypothetical protein
MQYLTVLQAHIECAVVGKIQQCVERLYKDGRPLHHQQSATSLEYDPTSGTSTFFVMTLEEFKQLDGLEVQDVFCNRSLLIPGPAPNAFHFDRQGLAHLGSLGVERTMQGICQICIT